MFKPLQRWLQFILVISLVFNPVLGSSMMVHADSEADSITTAVSYTTTDHAGDSLVADHHCDSPASTATDCCCPMAFSGCGGSAIHVTFAYPLLHGTPDWQPTASAYWQNRLIDVIPVHRVCSPSIRPR